MAGRRRSTRIGVGTAVGVCGLVGAGWLGLRVRPEPLPAYLDRAPPPAVVPLPDGLPTPVERYYREIYGEHIPVLTSAVVSGRGTVHPVGGVDLPVRFRFIHAAGRAFRSYIQVTFFGVPLMNVDETFLDGHGRGVTPFGVEEGARTDQGANLRLWAESLALLPAVLLTDERVRWEPLDDAAALLVVPFGDTRERFVVRFDPDTGRLWVMETMRYKGAAGAKTLWINETLGWATVSGYRLPAIISSTWLDDGRPWAVFTIEDVAYNVDVSRLIRASGPG
ncbi:MAG: hypothetical protein IT305_28745 [Chloroflexi bacterium]|nr:hypothetical protein [Chloroflexota bacterium]